MAWAIFKNSKDLSKSKSAAGGDEVRANLDRSLESTLDRYERRINEAEARAELWERRARRVDEWAHDYRHDLCNIAAKYGEHLTIPPVPKLEDPF